MYSLEDIYEQADKDRFAVSLDNDYYKSKLVYGVKIIKDKSSNEIEILNTMNSGDYYSKATKKELEVFLENIGEKKFRAKQIFGWIHKGIENIDEMNNLSKPLREKLKEKATIGLLKIENVLI